MATEPKLTPRQRMFAEHYVTNFDATQAALKAGYSAKSAMSQGCQQLKNPKVKKLIDELLEDTGDQNRRLKAKIMGLLEEAISFDPTNIIDQDGTIQDMRKLPGRLIEGFKPTRTGVQALMFSKQKATELLMRHLGMLAESVDITTKNEKLEINVSSGKVAEALKAAVGQNPSK